MIKIILVNGVYCPVLICDYCHSHIDNPKMAGYFYDVDETYKPIDPMYVLHKGCVRQLEGQRGKRFSQWDEVRYLLERLKVNTCPIDTWEVM